MSRAQASRAPLRAREWALALVLTLTGGLAWWWQSERVPVAPPGPAPARYPDFVVDGLQALTMDVAGKPSRRLWATQLRHYPDDGSSELDHPVLLAFDQDDHPDGAPAATPPPPWQARGNSGWITERGDELLLQGDVVVERAATASTPAMRLTSSELLVLPDFNYAETADFARLVAGADWVTAASGLRVWFEEPMRVKLFGRVHASRSPAARDAGAPTPPGGAH